MEVEDAFVFQQVNQGTEGVAFIIDKGASRLAFRRGEVTEARGGDTFDFNESGNGLAQPLVVLGGQIEAVVIVETLVEQGGQVFVYALIESRYGRIL
jgi:hypothetical protein